MAFIYIYLWEPKQVDHTSYFCSLVILPSFKTKFLEFLKKFAIVMTSYTTIFMQIQPGKNLIKIFLKSHESAPDYVS